MNGNSWRMTGNSAALLAANLSLGGCASGGGEQPAALRQKVENARATADHEELLRPALQCPYRQISERRGRQPRAGEDASGTNGEGAAVGVDAFADRLRGHGD